MWTFFAFCILVGWFGVQFRPARRFVWEYRWKAWWTPFGLALHAAWKMLWRGFVADPLGRAWRWQSAKTTGKRIRSELDTALDRLLGRDGADG